MLTNLVLWHTTFTCASQPGCRNDAVLVLPFLLEYARFVATLQQRATLQWLIAEEFLA